MAISTTSVISDLQTLHTGIAGVKQAPTGYRASINTSQLPFVLVWPSFGDTSQISFKAFSTERVYKVKVYVEPVGQNNLDRPIQTAIDLLDDFLQVYMRNCTLSVSGGQIDNIEDTGIFAGSVASEDLVYSGVEYTGFVVNLTITEHEQI